MISLLSILIVINLIVDRQCQEIDDSFKCASGNQTLPLDFRCDSINNCNDGSDEDDCVCPSGKFRGSHGYCISDVIEFVAHRYCNMRNGQMECAVECGPDEFRCSSAKCIPKSLCCDGKADCLYSIDEWTKDCLGKKKILDYGKSSVCPYDELYCYTRQVDKEGYHCASNYEECFHAHECEIDGCKWNKACPEDQFRCYDAPCLDKKFLCDGKWNCYGGADESPVACDFKSKLGLSRQVTLGTARAIAVYLFVIFIVVAITVQVLRIRRKIRSRVNGQLEKLNNKSPDRSPSVEVNKTQSVEKAKSKSQGVEAPKSSENKPKSVTEAKSKLEASASKSKPKLSLSKSKILLGPK